MTARQCAARLGLSAVGPGLRHPFASPQAQRSHSTPIIATSNSAAVGAETDRAAIEDRHTLWLQPSCIASFAASRASNPRQPSPSMIGRSSTKKLGQLPAKQASGEEQPFQMLRNRLT